MVSISRVRSTFLTASASQISPRTNAYRGSPWTSARFSRLPAYVSESKFTTRTRSRRCSRCRTKLLPIKPAPPVTRMCSIDVRWATPEGEQDARTNKSALSNLPSTDPGLHVWLNTPARPPHTRVSLTVREPGSPYRREVWTFIQTAKTFKNSQST